MYQVRLAFNVNIIPLQRKSRILCLNAKLIVYNAWVCIENSLESTSIKPEWILRFGHGQIYVLFCKGIIMGYFENLCNSFISGVFFK